MIKEILSNSEYFGFCLTVLLFFLCMKLQEKIKKKHKMIALMANPLLMASFSMIILLKLTGITYEQFQNGGKYLYYFLTPATVCLAVPLYHNMEKIKQNFWAVMTGILAGCLTNIVSVIVFVSIYGMKDSFLASLLAKSVTTPIALEISRELGGMEAITVLVVILTGLCGGILAPFLFRIFKIRSKMARGIALGTSAHGTGTGVASTFGEEEAAMSGLAMSVNGILNVIIIPIVMNYFIL